MRNAGHWNICKILRLTAVVVAGAIGVITAPGAFARPWHTHASVGLYLGVPIGWPYWGPYWPYPYYYPPYPERIVVVPSEPPVYVERPGAQTAPDAGYWYYCAGSGAYYPYVKECPGGWQRVAPRPPGE